MEVRIDNDDIILAKDLAIIHCSGAGQSVEVALETVHIYVRTAGSANYIIRSHSRKQDIDKMLVSVPNVRTDYNGSK